MLHDRRRGMFDLFRMSPIASGDLLTGKYAAFACWARSSRWRCWPCWCSASACRSSRAQASWWGRWRLLVRGVDRHRHRGRPRIRLGPPGRPGRPARPARLGVLQRPRARPRPVLGPSARRERAAAGHAGGLAAAGPDAARARRLRRGARSCWPRWPASCSWPAGSSSAASSTGPHWRPQGRSVPRRTTAEGPSVRTAACGWAGQGSLGSHRRQAGIGAGLKATAFSVLGRTAQTRPRPAKSKTTRRPRRGRRRRGQLQGRCRHGADAELGDRAHAPHLSTPVHGPRRRPGSCDQRLPVPARDRNLVFGACGVDGAVGRSVVRRRTTAWVPCSVW